MLDATAEPEGATMPTSPRAQRTDFSLDIVGRYTCNGLDEAVAGVGPGARPFDLIVVGGGSFDAALAQQLFANDQAQVHRILVLESGPLALPEHVQNMPLQGLGVPPATSIAQLRSQGLDGQPRAEVWGLAWHSSTPFPGLAYCLAGRSLHFGGWSPQLLNDEMPTAANAPSRWPQAVVNDLNNRYFAESAAQIGTEETNDFIFGPLQNALRQALYDGINNGAITEAIPLGNLPDHPVLRSNPGANAARLRELLDNPAGAGGLSVQELRNLLKLEAPLAVQGQTCVHPGRVVGAHGPRLCGGLQAPLTASQVAQLKDAGARVQYVYRNFGGAAVGMTDAAASQVRSLSFVTSVTTDQAAEPTALGSPLPGNGPYWLDLIDAERNSSFDGSGVWVAGLDSGFYPNWRDYFDPASILTQYATAFVSVGANQNQNQWDVGSDPHGMATAATVVGHRLVDDTNEGGWGTGYLTGAAGTYWVPGVAPGAKFIPIKVCEPIGCFDSAIIAAYDYLIGLKRANPGQPLVINQSLGGGSLSPVERPRSMR
jgi:Subtilase family